MSKNKKKNGQVNGVNNVLNNETVTKINCQFTETKTVETTVSYKINKCTLADIKKRIETKITAVNKKEELTAEQKTARIEKLTVENEIKSLVTKLENSVIFMYILRKDGEIVTILEDENGENGIEINMDKKRLIGQTMLEDKIKLHDIVQNILIDGRSVNFQYIRGMKYILEESEKSVITYQHISMRNFNSFSRADKEKIKNAKTLKFDNITIITNAELE